MTSGAKDDHAHILIFVYGTLLSGEGNHSVLGRAPLVTRAVTAPRYTLIDLGHFPAMLDHGRVPIIGEVYRCDPATLAALDCLEGHPRFYVRRDVALARGPERAQAYFLASRRAGAAPIDSGDWRAHQRAKADARDPVGAGLRDLARGRPTARALAALAAMGGHGPAGPKRRA